jgi:hypothetical protein
MKRKFPSSPSSKGAKANEREQNREPLYQFYHVGTHVLSRVPRHDTTQVSTYRIQSLSIQLSIFTHNKVIGISSSTPHQKRKRVCFPLCRHWPASYYGWLLWSKQYHWLIWVCMHAYANDKLHIFSVLFNFLWDRRELCTAQIVPS